MKWYHDWLLLLRIDPTERAFDQDWITIDAAHLGNEKEYATLRADDAIGAFWKDYNINDSSILLFSKSPT